MSFSLNIREGGFCVVFPKNTNRLVKGTLSLCVLIRTKDHKFHNSKSTFSVVLSKLNWESTLKSRFLFLSKFLQFCDLN